jgi:hypothetical protein
VSAADTVVHTYGVVASPEAPLPAAGIGGTPVGALDLAEVVAVVGWLPADRYGPEQWEAHGQDPRWLEPLAREHHRVLQALCDDPAVADVVPLRLPGIYRDLDAVRETLVPRTAELRRALDEIRGHAEWGVKIFLARPAQTSPEPVPATGRDYLRRRSEAVTARETSRERRHHLVSAAYAGVTLAAARSRVTSPQDKVLTGRSEPMLHNSAHLVRRAEQETFFAALAQASDLVAPEGMVVEVSGPWPPYSFARLEGEGTP